MDRVPRDREGKETPSVPSDLSMELLQYWSVKMTHNTGFWPAGGSSIFAYPTEPT